MSSEIHQGKIFNVDETKTDESRLETTAALAELEAPDSRTARQMEKNAEREHDAAVQAASVAKASAEPSINVSLGSDYTGEPSTAAGQFKQQAAATTDKAVDQGKRDVDAAVGYMDQARAAVSSAIETAQQYIHNALSGEPMSTPTGTSTTQRSATTPGGQHTVLENAQETVVNTLHSAEETAKDAMNAFKTATQAQVARAEAAAQGMTGMVGTQGADLKPTGKLAEDPFSSMTSQPSEAHGGTGATSGVSTAVKPPSSSTGIPATTAPLESGKHKIDGTTYPSTTGNLRADELARNAESRN